MLGHDGIFSPEFVLSKKLPLIICALVLFAAAFWSGWSEWSASTFIPFNGHFQNFWPLERMSKGEMPFVDFPVYLGAGHLYAAWPLFYLLGGDFRAATAAHNVLAGLCLAGSLVATMRLLGWRWLPTMLSSAAIYQIFITLATAWSSVIGFRSFLPAAVGLTVRYLLPSKSAGLPRVIAYGLAMGFAPLWSNDYGIPASIAMGIVLMLSRPGKRNVLIAAGTTTVGLILAVSLASWGHPMAWLRSSVLEPSTAQAWYFNPIAENKIYSLLDFPWQDGAFLLGCACTAILLFTWPGENKTGLGLQPRNHAAVTALVLCALGGFSLSCLGGTYEMRYAVPLWRYMLPVSLTVVLLLLDKTPLGALKERYALFRKYPVLSGALSAVLLATSIGYAEHPFVLHANLVAAENSNLLQPVPSLGLKSWPQVAAADSLGRSLRAQGIAVAANYSSVVSIASDSHQIGPNYLIHAFGDAAQERYHALLNQGSQGRWETLDPNILAWGLWNIRMAWPLHRDLFLGWQPTERTAWTLLWSRRETILEMHPARCEIVYGEGVRPELLISADLPTEGAWWADVSIDVATTFQRGFTPIAGNTKLIDLVEGEDAPEGADPTVIVSNRWTAPLRDGLIQTPVIVSRGSPTLLRLRSWPKGRSSVKVVSCSARLVAPISATLLPAPQVGVRMLTTTQDIRSQDTEWIEGDKKAIRIITANPYDALTLRRGDRIILKDGHMATIVLRDFGSLAYVPDEESPTPEPGSDIQIIPCALPQPLAILVLPMKSPEQRGCQRP